MSRSFLLRGASAGALAFVYVSSTLAQEALPPIEIGAAPSAPPPAAAPAPAAASPAPTAAPGFDPERAKLPIYRNPPGQTTTTVKTDFLQTTPMTTVQDMLRYSPGVTFSDSGAPVGDMSISIRGSGARSNQYTRNIRIYEDGFPITTADGFAHTDILDPHAFSAVDVYRGPSSAMFGNYAYGGAINFRTYSGKEIDGVETGSEFGSFTTINNYLLAGKKVTDKNLGEAEISIFASEKSSAGYIAHTDSNQQNANLLLKLSPTQDDRLILKLIYNRSFSDLSIRDSETQYYLNPYAQGYGCSIASVLNKPFCNNLNQYANGLYGATVSQNPAQFGQHYDELREIVGFRWEHDFNNATTWRSQFTYDYLDNAAGTWLPPKITGGPGGPVALKGPQVGVSASTDVTHRATIFGFPTTSYLGFFFDNLKLYNPTSAYLPNAWNLGMVGGPVSVIDSFHSNIGLRAREEIALRSDLTAAIGFSSNWNRVWGNNTVYNFSAKGAVQTSTAVAVDNEYWNTAPESSLTWRYNPEWQFRARYATGYGTPNFLYLTGTPNGVGDNSTMKAQTNMGVDLGADWTPTRDLTFSVTGFHEWFRNEILQLTTPSSLTYYWLNIPQSVHRGVEVNGDWRPYEGVRLLLAYTFNDQRFVNFWDPLSATAYFQRAGNYIPNVAPHTLTARAGYDVPHGQFAGLGGYVEYVYKSDYALDNANLLWAPGYGLVNLNLHYGMDVQNSWLKRFEVYFDVKNVANRVYVAGSGVVTDALIAGTAVQQNAALLSTNTGAAFIAGPPRSFQGGIKFKF